MDKRLFETEKQNLEFQVRGQGRPQPVQGGGEAGVQEHLRQPEPVGQFHHHPTGLC